MDLQEWRAKRRGEKMVLPSGLTVVVRRVDLLDLAVRGDIPAPLVGVADRLVGGISVKVTEFKATEPVINLVVSACLVEPKVADTADETHLVVEELSMQDRLAIYSWVNSGVAELAPFRGEHGQSG